MNATFSGENISPGEAIIKGPADYVGSFVLGLMRRERAAAKQEEMPAVQAGPMPAMDPTRDQSELSLQ